VGSLKVAVSCARLDHQPDVPCRSMFLRRGRCAWLGGRRPNGPSLAAPLGTCWSRSGGLGTVGVDYLYLLHALAHIKITRWRRTWRDRSTVTDRLAIAALISTGLDLWLR